MQENITAARPYSQAVFEQAQEEENLGKWADMLNVISMVISDPQMQAVLENPRLNAELLADFVLDICGSNLTDEGGNFVRVLANAGRLSLAPHIYTLYEQRRTEAEGVVEVEVISAYPLEDAEKNRLSDAMAGRFGKKINVTTRIDKSLIGGTVIRAGDSVIDASVRGRLKQLGSELAE